MAIEYDEYGQWRNRIDMIMETIYDDMVSGLKKDLTKLIEDYGSHHKFIYDVDSIFLNYAFNRTHEFKDPEKAERKAFLARKILLELKTEINCGLKDC